MHLHMGIDNTYERLSRSYYWPGMLKDVTRYINSCGSCRKNKSRNRSEIELTSGMAYTEQRWDVIHVDLFHYGFKKHNRGILY